MAPSNSSARAAAAPRASEPQTGWPPTKRARSAPSMPRTTFAFVEPMSVTVASGGAAATVAATAAGSCATGAQTTTSSASRAGLARSVSCAAATQPRSSAAARAEGSGS